MTPMIKICGLSTVESVQSALDNGADMIGFIFFPKSPRHVTIEQAANLRALAKGRAQVVAVTVDADADTMEAIVAGMQPDMLQLHGHETPESVWATQMRFHLPVMKAISVHEASDLDVIAAYAGMADKLLLDAKAPKGSLLPGGNGVSFDWNLLNRLDPGLDYMLSGGLNAGNVNEALAISKAPGLDVSSGVERAPGVKDVALIKEFFDSIRHGRQGDM